MQRNWIISNNSKLEVYAFLLQHYISFEPSGCFDSHTCIAAWNMTIEQASLVEQFILSNHYGYCMDKIPIPMTC